MKTTSTTLPLLLMLLMACSSSNTGGSDGDSDGDADSDIGGNPDDCSNSADCVLGCRGDCCACPEVVNARELEENPDVHEPIGTECPSSCEMACSPCPPTPEPACIEGYCVPRDGCVTARDCTLVTQCQCRCFVAASWADALTDNCLVPQRDPSTGCEDCEYDPSDCRLCAPEPVGVFCAGGYCFPDYGPEGEHEACGGAAPDCSPGYECYPGEGDCGFGATGVCLPAHASLCGGESGTPCRESVDVCLATSGCSGCQGICVTPTEIRQVCTVAPDCFECD